LIVVRKAMMIGFANSSMAICCLLAGDVTLNAQQTAHGQRASFPWACLYFAPAGGDNSADSDDPEERRLSAGADEVYRLWCTSSSSSRQSRERAADAMATQWKRLWYRDDPFNAAFHETGSFGLLVLMGITHRVPKPMADDAEFMRDWLADCSDRCFMTYGDDDPSAKAEWQKLLRLRNEVSHHLGSDPAAKPVLTMLKNAKLYPVN
jgi:hypothetical protein